MIKDVSADRFTEEVLEATLPVIVEFYTPTCHFCKRFEPILDAVSEKNSESIKVYRVNAAENRDLAVKYNIFGVPTTIMFSGGQEVDRISGLVSEAELTRKIESVTA